MPNSLYVITLHSFKGGSGKSTISINFANILTDLGKRVLLIENDLLMPTYKQIFDEHWKDESPRIYWNHYLSTKEVKPIEELIRKTKFGFDVICADPDFKPNELFAFADKKKFREWLITLQKVKMNLKNSNQYDYIIFDSSPGWNFLIINNLIISDSVILVSRLNKYEVEGTRRMIEDIYSKTRSWDKNLFLLWNQVPRLESEKIDPLIKEIEDKFRANNEQIIGKFGRIPLSDQYSYKTALGELMFNDKDSFHIKKVLKDIIMDIIDN